MARLDESMYDAHKRRRWSAAAMAGMLLAVVLPVGRGQETKPAERAQAVVTTLDARQIRGPVVEVTDEAVVVQAEGPRQRLAREDVARIRFAEVRDVLDRPGAAVVVTRTGGCLAAENLRLAKGDVTFRTRSLGAVRLPLSAVDRVLLPRVRESAGQLEQRFREARREVAGKDVFYVREEDALLSVRGVLEGMDHRDIHFTWRESKRRMPRADVAIIDAAPAGAAPAAPAGAIALADGSRVGFRSLRMDATTVTAELAALGRRELPRTAVAAVEFHSDRVVPLSSLEPVKVVEYGFFDKVFPHRVGRAVSGGPLRMGGRTYEQGLGLHSTCELHYDLGGRYRVFVTMAGIDDAVRPRGDAALTVLGDGKELLAPLRLRGQDAAKRVRVEVEGVKRLVVRVGFGEDGLDVADHVDLADARLIR